VAQTRKILIYPSRHPRTPSSLPPLPTIFLPSQSLPLPATSHKQTHTYSPFPQPPKNPHLPLFKSPPLQPPNNPGPVLHLDQIRSDSKKRMGFLSRFFSSLLFFPLLPPPASQPAQLFCPMHKRGLVRLLDWAGLDWSGAEQR
jgi:hypothetical protein